MADHRIFYGSDPNQFGDLWIDEKHAEPPLAVVAFFHGGWWKSKYDLAYAGHLCQALKQEGIAIWSIEYRRVGKTGGGWPATFQDAAAGFDHLVKLSKSFPLDLSRVITMGHSAGGHLAFWIAGRHHVDRGSPVFRPSVVALRGAVSLAGAVDLRMLIDLAGHGEYAHDKDEVLALMGGGPNEVKDRYTASNPGDLLPLHVAQVLIQGKEDDQIPPELPSRWASKARSAGDTVSVKLIPDADHFDVVDPESRAWRTVVDSVRELLSS